MLSNSLCLIIVYIMPNISAVARLVLNKFQSTRLKVYTIYSNRHFESQYTNLILLGVARFSDPKPPMYEAKAITIQH